MSYKLQVCKMDAMAAVRNHTQRCIIWSQDMLKNISISRRVLANLLSRNEITTHIKDKNSSNELFSSLLMHQIDF